MKLRPPLPQVMAVPVPRSVYDDLATGGSPIGWHMRQMMQSSIQTLWQRVNLPGGDKRRQLLPERCDKEWFVRTFCDGVAGAAACAVDRPIWPYIKNLHMSDPIALIAAIPDLRTRFLKPKIVSVDSSVGRTEHLIIGASESDRGVARVDALRAFLLNSIDNGIALSEQHATPLVIISDPGQDQDDEMALVMLRALTEKGFVKCSAVVTNLKVKRERERVRVKSLGTFRGEGNVPSSLRRTCRPR